MAKTCDEIIDAVEIVKHAEEVARLRQPLVRLWDAEFNLQHVIRDERNCKVTFISNDTGPGQLELDFETPAAKWILDYNSRIDRGEGRGICMTVDYAGARWSGTLDKFVVEQRNDGDVALVIDFASDHEYLKYYSATPNPIQPDWLQFPRAFLMAGPITWALSVTLFLSIWREHQPFFTWPDDPTDWANWVTLGLDISQWNVVVHPLSFLEAAQSGVVWGVVGARWTNYHDMQRLATEDAEISVITRRWLPEDGPPWDGADENTLRPGAVVVSFEDKSGINVGTATGGNMFSGLVRTVVQFADDFIDSTKNVLTDNVIPSGYREPQNKYTDPERPYVIFYEGDNSQIEHSALIHSTTKCVQIEVGGHSMPGVNEALSATIQGIGDVLGNLAFIGSLGGSIDTLVAPLYTDTLFAFLTYKSSNRASDMGWDRKHAYFQDGAGKAYTISSVLAIRAGMWATKAQTSWTVEVSDGLPYVIGGDGAGTGGNGKGHFFLDDRVGLVLKADPNKEIHIDRCRKIELAWSDELRPEWRIHIGDDRIWEDPATRALGKIERIQASLHDLGVF